MQMRGHFAQLLAKEASELDLEAELRLLVEQYNASLGPRARWVWLVAGCATVN
jgi:hypothetical protein